MIADISNRIEPSERAYRQIVECPFCGGSDYLPITKPARSDYGRRLIPILRDMKFQMVQCADCDVIYQRSRPKDEYLGQFYSTDEYHCYESLLRQRGFLVGTAAIASARKVVRKIERFRPKRSNLVVDFGCGTGSWIELFKHVRAPWSIVGTEVSDELCSVVERSGTKCLRVDHENIDRVFEPRSIDVLFMNHVIEHLPNPLSFLRKAAKVLTDGGVIYGQTPCWRCCEERVFGTFWHQWHLPHHLVIFDRKSLADHAAKAGLKAERIAPSLSGVTQWGHSLLKWIATRRGREYLNTKDPIYPVVTAAFLPVAGLQCLFAYTSHMDFLLRKVP